MSIQFKSAFAIVVAAILGAAGYFAFKEYREEADTIVLGATLSLTGKYSAGGRHTKNGYDLAVARINERGGVKIGDKSYPLEIVYYDDESTPARGAQIAERLIKQDGVKYMLGPYSSGLTGAIAPVMEKYRVPMVQANGASLSLFNKGYKYLFGVLSTTQFYLKEAVNLAAQQARKNGGDPKTLKVAMAFENDPFSQDIRAGVVEDAQRHGMTIVIDDTLPPELDDMAGTLAKVKTLKPDLLVVSGHAKGAAIAVRQVAEMKVDVPMLAMTNCDSAGIIAQFGAKAEYILCASQWDRGLLYRDGWFGTAEDYARAFEEVYKHAPPYQSAESTAAVLTFVDAFQRAASLDPEKVRLAIAATNMQTFYGNIKFDSAGKNIAKPMVLYQVQGGKYKVVAPARWATSKPIHPAPAWGQR